MSTIKAIQRSVHGEELDTVVVEKPSEGRRCLFIKFRSGNAMEFAVTGESLLFDLSTLKPKPGVCQTPLDSIPSPAFSVAEIDVRELSRSKATFGVAVAMFLIEAGYIVVRQSWDKSEGEGIMLVKDDEDGKMIVHARDYGEETGCLYFPEPEDLVGDDWMIVLDVEALDAEEATPDSD